MLAAASLAALAFASTPLRAQNVAAGTPGLSENGGAGLTGLGQSVLGIGGAPANPNHLPGIPFAEVLRGHGSRAGYTLTTSAQPQYEPTYELNRLSAGVGFLFSGSLSLDLAYSYSFWGLSGDGVTMDDLEHRAELAVLFRDAGFQERDWSHPIPTKVIHRRDRAAG